MCLYKWLHFVPCDSPLPSGTSEPGYTKSFNDGSKKCKKTSRNMQGFRRLRLATGTSSILKGTWLNLKSRGKEIYPDPFVGESSLLQGKKKMNLDCLSEYTIVHASFLCIKWQRFKSGQEFKKFMPLTTIQELF